MNKYKKYLLALKKEDLPHFLILIFLFLEGFALRFAFLFQPMCFDESVTYLAYALHPLSYGLSCYVYPNNHLFNTFLVHFTTKIFGNSPWVIRLPAFIAGVLIIPLSYLVVRKLFDKNAAIITAALIVTCSQLIEYSTNARGYSIQALIVLAAIIVSFNLIKKGGLANWVWLTLLFAMGFYAIPTMLYFFLGIILWLVLSLVKGEIKDSRIVFARRIALMSISTLILVILLYLPVINNSGISSLISNRWVKSLGWSKFAKSLFPGLKEYWSAWAAGIPLPISILLITCVIISVIFHRRLAKNTLNLLYTMLVASILIVIVQRRLPPARAWLPLLPLILGFSADGLSFLWEKLENYFRKKSSFKFSFNFIPIIALVIAIGLGISILISQSPYQPPDQSPFRDAEKIAKFLKPKLKRGDIIYVESYSHPHLDYYFYVNGLPLSYIWHYEFEKSMDKEFKKTLKRAFVIDVKEKRPERPIPALTEVMYASELDRSRPYYLKEIKKFSHSIVYEIENPVFD